MKASSLIKTSFFVLALTLVFSISVWASAVFATARADGHEHNDYSYAVDGNVLTATCLEEECDLPRL